MRELSTSCLAHQANRIALQDNIQHMSFLLSIFSSQNPQSYFLSLANTRIPFLLCSIFWGQDFQILDTKISSTWGKAKKKNWKARSLINQVIKYSETNVHSKKRLHHATMHYTGCPPVIQKEPSKWWAWGPATCIGPLPTVYEVLCSTWSAIIG